MPVISGIDMAINSVPTAHQFNIELSKELIEVIATGGSGGVRNKCGVNDGRGVASAYGYLPQVWPGSSFTFTGSLDGTYGFSGTSYCEAVEIIWDVENGRYIAYTIQFSRNGAITPGAAVATDSTKPNPPCSQSLPLKFNTVEQTEVAYMRLKLMCPGFPRNTTSTAGGRVRTRGAMSGEFEYHQYYQDPATLPSRGLAYIVQPYCTASLYYDIAYMTPETIASYANPNSRRPVNARVVMKFDANNATDTGYIRTPEAVPSTVWPFS